MYSTGPLYVRQHMIIIQHLDGLTQSSQLLEPIVSLESKAFFSLSAVLVEASLFNTAVSGDLKQYWDVTTSYARGDQITVHSAWQFVLGRMVL